MSEQIHNPRILIVTPEVTYLPEGMGDIANGFSAKAGGLADVSAALISALIAADMFHNMPENQTKIHCIGNEVASGILNFSGEEKRLSFGI